MVLEETLHLGAAVAEVAKVALRELDGEVAEGNDACFAQTQSLPMLSPQWSSNSRRSKGRKSTISVVWVSLHKKNGA